MEGHDCERYPMERHLDGLAQAVAFYRKVQSSTDDEKIAVGHDHWDWLLRAAMETADAHARIMPPNL